MVTPLEVLGLLPGATETEVKARWKLLASHNHPDKGGEAEQFHYYKQAYDAAMAEFKKIKKCEKCQGLGYFFLQRGFASIRTKCGACHGKGVN